MSDTQIVVVPPTPTGVAFVDYDTKRDLIRKLIAPDTTDDEFEMFMAYCKRVQLDPIARQIVPIVRGSGDRRKLTIQTTIDGLRLIAKRSGHFAGRVGPWWCGQDMVWHDIWLKDIPPAAAKVGVKIKGEDEPTLAVVTWKEFAVYESEGKLAFMWRDKPAHMLAKCAEAQALRSALPAELSGIYTDDEMERTTREADRQAAPPDNRAPADRPTTSKRPWQNDSERVVYAAMQDMSLPIPDPRPNETKEQRASRFDWMKARVDYRYATIEYERITDQPADAPPIRANADDLRKGAAEWRRLAKEWQAKPTGAQDPLIPPTVVVP